MAVPAKKKEGGTVNSVPKKKNIKLR